MTKPIKILNDYEYKFLLLEGSPKFGYFYKDQLIEFLEVAQKIIREDKNLILALENKILCALYPEVESLDYFAKETLRRIIEANVYSDVDYLKSKIIEYLTCEDQTGNK